MGDTEPGSKYSRASLTGTMMLNPRVECSTSSSLQNLVADVVMDEVWAPWLCRPGLRPSTILGLHLRRSRLWRSS